jgi:hypothetical protein
MNTSDTPLPSGTPRFVALVSKVTYRPVRETLGPLACVFVRAPDELLFTLVVLAAAVAVAGAARSNATQRAPRQRGLREEWIMGPDDAPWPRASQGAADALACP